MARNTNSVKSINSIIKLQALVRGFLVRKQFSQLKQDYDEIVQCFEGKSSTVKWKNNSKLCLPIVDHVSAVVLNDNLHQKIDYESNDFRSENSNIFDKETPVKVFQDEASVSKEFESLTEPVLKNTNEVNNCTSKDSEISDKCSLNSPNKDCTISLENSIDSPSTTEDNRGRNKVDENGITEVVIDQSSDHSHQGGPTNTGSCSNLHQTYPNDKLSLLKLREDLTMELLWIEQAIESRKNYLGMKENVLKHSGNHS